MEEGILRIQTNLITIKKFASMLEKPQSTVYSWKNNGDLPKEIFYQIGGTWFVKIDKFNELTA